MTVRIHRTSIEEAGTITTAKGEEPVWKVLFEMSYQGGNKFSLHFDFKIVGQAGSAQAEEAAYQELRTFLDEASTEVASRANPTRVQKLDFGNQSGRRSALRNALVFGSARKRRVSALARGPEPIGSRLVRWRIGGYIAQRVGPDERTGGHGNERRGMCLDSRDTYSSCAIVRR